MSGISGIFSSNNLQYEFNTLFELLYKSDYVVVDKHCDERLKIGAMHLREYHTPFFENDEIILFFEGYLLDDALNHKAISKYLAKKYHTQKEHFVNDLRGSFQIVIYDKKTDSLLVFVDHTASRQIAYSFDGKQLYFSPEIPAIQSILKFDRVDHIAEMNFLTSGFFPAGKTFLADIRMLKPGEYLKCVGNTLEIRQYYSYKVIPDDSLTKSDITAILEPRLERAIRQSWEQAKNPAVLLSGGYDSQFIFYTLAELVDDTSKIITVTWGDDLSIPDSDVKAANKIAERFGTQHFVMKKSAQTFKNDFIEMFQAHSGMTDCTLDHANELQVCKELREKGISSLFRGDECFGFRNMAYTEQAALSMINMTFPKYLLGANNLLIPEKKYLLDEYEEYLNALINSYKPAKNNEIKDSLYFSQRFAMYLQPLNYFKYNFQQIYNPLVDTSVLEVARKIPNKFRVDKMLFKESLDRKFGKKYNPIYAVNHNMINWQNEIDENNELRAFYKEAVDSLPSYYNRDYLKTKIITSRKTKSYRQFLKKLLKNMFLVDLLFKKRIKKHVIPNANMMLRITTLAQWYKILKKQ